MVVGVLDSSQRLHTKTPITLGGSLEKELAKLHTYLLICEINRCIIASEFLGGALIPQHEEDPDIYLGTFQPWLFSDKSILDKVYRRCNPLYDTSDFLMKLQTQLIIHLAVSTAINVERHFEEKFLFLKKFFSSTLPPAYCVQFTLTQPHVVFVEPNETEGVKGAYTVVKHLSKRLKLFIPFSTDI